MLDVIIIGSGYGGSAVAARTAPHAKVLLLERGRAWRPGDFPESLLGLARAYHSARNPLGLWAMRLGRGTGNAYVSGLGGASLVNYGITASPPPHVFDRWPLTAADLAPDYARALDVLRPTPYPGADALAVKAATGEDVTSEELGGAEIHTAISGVADHYADNDVHAIQICRNIFESFPVPQRQQLEMKEVEEPGYDPSEIYGLLPESSKDPIDPYEIIMRLTDGSRFHEFKARYGTTIVTGFAHIMGFPVGIIANNGILFSESALKATHFIELCNFRKIPIVFLQNITGFIVGKEFEHRGIARDGAKMVHAVASSVVPKFTIITGGSFGAGNYAMAGRAYDPRFLFMWPNSRISVMGGEQAAEVLVRVKEEQGNSKNSAEDLKKLRDEILKKYEYEGSAYYSSSRLWDDGIIDPADTRKILALAISVSLNKKFPDPKTGVYRM